MAGEEEEPRVTLYTAGTPNGWKAAVLLEELGLPYKVRPISISKGEQKEDWYLKINPNGRIPAIVDHGNGDYAVFESGALMMYLCDHYGDGSLFPKVEDDKARYEVIAWLMFQMSGLGPMQGQANHFVRYAPVQIEYGKERYVNETKRLYSVLDKQLEGKEWIAAGRYTIADIACFTWVFIHFWSDVDIEEFPNLKAWKERIEKRPAVLRGLDVPEPTKFKEAITDKAVREQMINEIRAIITPTSAPK
ncbi:unnamed protein product [Ostreobium quekettii]|uniref:Glutathione S-transferase n=1 Tax=Ostreobium quekettii TaxID=121088 RepID=A0A8S1IVC1_9CHLO|nr:unnamed protein product [Ostreobium quekettii]